MCNLQDLIKLHRKDGVYDEQTHPMFIPNSPKRKRCSPHRAG
jgi:hypothetical protein